MNNNFSKIMIISTIITSSFMGMEQKQQWDGEHYHLYSSPQFDAAMQHLQNLDFKKWSRIIDIGCASGDVAAAIADRAPESKVVGIDLSENMVATAKRLYGSRSNLQFRALNAQNLDYTQEFDGAVSFLTVHWIENKPAFFQKLFASLKPNGEFFMSIGTKNEGLEELKKKFFMGLLQDPKLSFLMKTDMITANNAVSKDELQEMVSAAGFKDIQIEEEIEIHDFSSKEDLRQFFGTFAGGYKEIAALPTETRETLITKAADEWIKLMPQGKVCYMWANLITRGKKPSFTV